MNFDQTYSCPNGCQYHFGPFYWTIVELYVANTKMLHELPSVAADSNSVLSSKYGNASLRKEKKVTYCSAIQTKK